MCEKYTQLREVVKTYCGVNSVCNTPPIYNWYAVTYPPIYVKETIILSLIELKSVIIIAQNILDSKKK
jgi:hypothetical protein